MKTDKWDPRNRIITVNAAAASTTASLIGWVASLWAAQGGTANIGSGDVVGLLICTGAGGLQLTTSASAGVGLQLAARTQHYMPIGSSSTGSDIQVTTTAAFAVAVFFGD